MKLTPLFFAILITTIGTASNAFADAAPSATPNQTIRQDRVVSASADSITISHSAIDVKASTAKARVTKEVSKTYKITPRTIVEVNGEKATAADIKPGMAVSVSAEGLSSLAKPGDAPDATDIRVHDVKAAPSPAATAAAKK